MSNTCVLGKAANKLKFWQDAGSRGRKYPLGTIAHIGKLSYYLNVMALKESQRLHNAEFILLLFSH